MILLNVLEIIEIAVEFQKQIVQLSQSRRLVTSMHCDLSSPFFTGVKGQVTDRNGNPIPNVIVEAQGRSHVCPYRTNAHGEYFLLLLPGKYVINVSVLPYSVIISDYIEFLSTVRLNPYSQVRL